MKLNYLLASDFKSKMQKFTKITEFLIEIWQVVHI